VSQLLQASHLPAPEREYVVRDPSGAFVAQVDLAYPLIRLAIELDSVAHHDNARSFVADRRRWNRLTTLGWTPLAFTYRDFTERPAELVQRVTEVYLRLERRSPPLRR
jgi:very-short-patch-repair endonuclease